MRAESHVVALAGVALLLLAACDLATRIAHTSSSDHEPRPATAEIEASMHSIEHWLPDPVVTQESFSSAGNGRYRVHGVEYQPWGPVRAYEERGPASWRGEPYDGFTTLTGEIFNIDELMAAHRYLPLPSYLRVTNPMTGASTVVRVNDRGPFGVDAIVDLSRAAAAKIGLLDAKKSEVHIALIHNSDLPIYYLETDAVYGVDRVRKLAESFSWLRNVDSAVLPHSNANWYRLRLGPFGNVEDAKRVRGWGILNTDTESTILEE